MVPGPPRPSGAAAAGPVPGSKALLASTAIVLVAAGLELLAAAGLAAGVSIGAWTLAGALGLAFGVTAALARATVRDRWVARAALACGTALLVLAAAAGSAGLLHDRSFDGQWYHQPAVEALARGWNPFRGHLPATEASGALFINHYAKGPWYRAAPLYALAGRMEPAKAWGLALAAAAGLAAFAAAVRLARWSAGRSALFAALVALNPVASAQAFTFYVDGQLASALGLLAASGAVAAAGRDPGRDPVALSAFACSVALAANAKFTGLAYAGLLAGALAAAAWAARGRRAGLALGAAAGAALIVTLLATGRDPYLTNLREKGHPFYPLAGPGAIDIVSGQLPRGFAGRGRVAKLAISTLSASDNGPAGELTPRPKLPFAIVSGEPPAFRAVDVRLGGFGPWFSGALVLAALVAALSLASGWRAAAPAILAAAALTASALVNPEAWWARYAPQLWLVPLALALAPAPRLERASRLVASALLAVLALDAALVAVNSVSRNREDERALVAELRALAAAPGGILLRVRAMDAVRVRLREAGVSFREVQELPCPSPRRLVASDAWYCPGG